MISARNLTKHFGRITALRNISFEIAQGEIIGFLGPNGAGKTTLMRILTTYLPATKGEAFVAGYDVFRNPMAVRKNLGYLPETPPLYQEMTVYDYLKFSARLKDIETGRIRTQVDRTLEECGIFKVRYQTIATLSKGYKQRVGIAQAILHDPQVLILDEPTSGLDPLQILQVRSLIKNLEQKRTVILSTHILSEIEQIAQRVIILKQGEIVADAPINTLLSDPKVPGKKLKLEEAFLNLTAEQ